MRKLLREGVDYGKVAEKAVAIIKGKGYNVVMFTLDGMETSDPEEARRFYIKDPNFMVTIDEDAALIRINKNSNVKLNEIEAAMKQLKNLAREYMLKSELKVFGKEITPKDFAYQAKKLRDSKMNGINEASFSRMHGYKKTSYQTLESTKLIVRHRRPIDEEKHGARSRQIAAIFIENAGERFKFPYNNLAGARAMARHIDEGGAMHDAVGEYIVESVGNMLKLVEFMRYTQSNKLINEDSEDIVKIVRENIAAYKNELKRFQGVTSYKSMCETVANREGSELEEETSDLKDMFTVRKFDEKIGETLPLIKRLVTEKNAWRAKIEEASTEAFAVTSTENLIEGDAIEFDSPMQKLGYKIRTLSERVTEESDLSKFVHKIGNKMIEGVELSKFETSVMRNVLENVVVAEEEVAEEDGFVDKLDEVMTDFERKMKVLEYDMDWDDEEDDYVDPEEVKATYPKDAVEYMLKDYDLVADDFVLSDRDYEAWADMYAKNGIDNLDGDGYYEWMKDFAENYIEEQVTEEPGDWDHGYNYEGPQRDEDECPHCHGHGEYVDPEGFDELVHCPHCDEGLEEDPNDWEDEEAEEELYKGFYGDDNEELGYDPEIQWMDPAGGIHYHDEDDPAAMYEDFDLVDSDGAPTRIGCSECGDYSMDLQDRNGDDFYYVCNTCGHDQTEHLPPTREQWIDCQDCEGSGMDDFSENGYCETCGGEGRFLEGLQEDSEDPRAMECMACKEITLVKTGKLPNGDAEYECENCGHYETGYDLDESRLRELAGLSKK